MSLRVDYPQNPAKTRYAPNPTSATDGFVDSGTEIIPLNTVQTFPLGISPTRSQRANRDLPYNAYDVRGSRMISIQLSSFNVATSAVIQLLASNDSLGYSPYYFFNPATSTWVNSATLPTGGTAAVPNSTIITIDNPWFAWLKVAVTTADTTTSQAYLTVYRRT